MSSRHRQRQPSSNVSQSQGPTGHYAVSFRPIRMWVGRLGFLLPTSLFMLDWFFLGRGILFRGSLTAYYHSGASDVFVCVLGITGFVLIVYMAGQSSSSLDRRESIPSTVAGATALLVAFDWLRSFDSSAGPPTDAGIGVLGVLRSVPLTVRIRHLHTPWSREDIGRR
jgi:hypothetical protein